MANLIDGNKPLRPPVAGQVNTEQRNASWLALRAARCVCGKAKRDQHAFCLDCYLRLPPAVQKALWQRVGHGFEEAYTAAEEWLA